MPRGRPLQQQLQATRSSRNQLLTIRPHPEVGPTRLRGAGGTTVAAFVHRSRTVALIEAPLPGLVAPNVLRFARSEHGTKGTSDEGERLLRIMEHGFLNASTLKGYHSK
ncbi:unnamed protein product [Ectocarpus sp. CCAP 1310/34]|nr:unnamed protein product [Ectocarpus sp. CCAP 1310/34]